jgi:hypothetical protein
MFKSFDDISLECDTVEVVAIFFLLLHEENKINNKIIYNRYLHILVMQVTIRTIFA